VLSEKGEKTKWEKTDLSKVQYLNAILN